jgi:protein-disulfide isomerase
VLAIACLLALLSAGYALHLWGQLSVADSGGPVTCPFDSEGDCADVWRSGFALTVERTTGLPVAAHGVLWSLVAFVLPAAAAAARARGGRGDVPWAAALVTAGVGVAVGMALAVAQLVDGRFCGSCGIAYAITLAYAGVCLFSTARVPWSLLGRGGAVAGAAAVLGFAGLALAAPERPGPAAADAHAGLALAAPERPGPAAADAHAGHAHADAHAAPLGHGAPPPEIAAGADGLQRFLANLSPDSAASLARELAAYRARPAGELRTPRALIGSPMAPVRITDYADFLCSHCAALHATLTQIRQIVPEGTLAIESHYFPLDGQCNPHISRASKEGVSCVAARALICLEGDPGAFQLAGELYTRQRGLTVEQIYQLAAPLRSRAALEKCVASAETEAKLKEDIEVATRHGIQGTPLVLVNGRQASPRAATLLALVLAGGDASHPAFAALPKPQGG